MSIKLKDVKKGFWKSKDKESYLNPFVKNVIFNHYMGKYANSDLPYWNETERIKTMLERHVTTVFVDDIDEVETPMEIITGVSIKIFSNDCGCLIGKAGSNIEEIKSKIKDMLELILEDEVRLTVNLIENKEWSTFSYQDTYIEKEDKPKEIII